MLKYQEKYLVMCTLQQRKRNSLHSHLSLFPHRFVSFYFLYSLSLSLSLSLYIYIYIPKHHSLLKLNINIYIHFCGNSQLSADLIFCPKKKKRYVCLFMFNNLNCLFSLYIYFTLSRQSSHNMTSLIYYYYY